MWLYLNFNSWILLLSNLTVLSKETEKCSYWPLDGDDGDDNDDEDDDHDDDHADDHADDHDHDDHYDDDEIAV